MWSVFKKALDLKVSSITILIVLGAVGVSLLLESKGNDGARVGGYACTGLFIFLCLYLVLYNHVRELFTEILAREREGHKQLIKNYKDLSREQNKTAIVREKMVQDGMTNIPANSSITFGKYKETSSNTQND